MSPQTRHDRFSARRAFTLAELLVSLAILAFIATFTIPKVLNSMQNAELVKQRAHADEVAGALAAALDTHYQKNGYNPNGTISIQHVVANLNYVKVLTTPYTIDNIPNASDPDRTCPNNGCWLLHSGGVLAVEHVGWTTCGAEHDQALRFYYDPDGVYTTSSPDGPGKSVRFFLHANRMVHLDNREPYPSCSCGACVGTSANYIPSWYRR